MKENMLHPMHINETEKITDSAEQILPVVTVEQNLSPAQATSRGTMVNQDFVIKNESGDVIGNFTLIINKPPRGEATAFFDRINVRGARGKGYGRAAYLAVIENLKQQHICLLSGWQLSRDSKKVWDWLVSEGRAELMDEGMTDETKEHSGYSTAKYKAV